MTLSRRLVIASAMIMLFGCASAPKHETAAAPAAPTTKGEQLLADGIKSYEDGEFKDAVVELQGALDSGLSKVEDKIRAHKYLAFTHCVSARDKQCRDEFKKVLDLDPGFDLKPAEAGHPLWGSVFRSVKAKYR